MRAVMSLAIAMLGSSSTLSAACVPELAADPTNACCVDDASNAPSDDRVRPKPIGAVEHESADAGASSPDGAGGTGDPVLEFNESVAPILGGSDGRSGACGACHAVAGSIGPPFLVPDPDMLGAILRVPGLIGRTPETSRLYTRGAHAGPAFSPAEAAIVAAFIVDWNARPSQPSSDGGAPPKETAPFPPIIGANSIALEGLDLALAGDRITFSAALVGSGDPSLMLSNMTVWTSSPAGVRIVHPYWAIWDTSGVPWPDPIDSFSGLDLIVPPDRTARLGSGYLILPHFPSGGRISVAFDRIEPKKE